MTHLNLPRLRGVLLVSALFTAPLAAQQDAPPTKKEEKKSEVTQLDEMLVTETASRVVEPLKEVPQTVRVVDSKTIERRQAAIPIEMLREQPGIWAVNVAAQGSPILRGQMGNRVIYLWDGVRINNGALFSGPNGFFNQFPVGAVDRMEVVLGSGSVQYGSDAIGGVVNVFSKPALFSDEPLIGGSVYARYGTNNGENTQTIDFYGGNSKFAFSGGITRQEVSDYHGPHFGAASPSGFDAIGGYANFAWRPTLDQELHIGWIYNDREDVDSYVQSKLNASGVPRIYGPSERRGIGKIDYTLSKLGNWSDELKFYGYYHFYDALRDRRVENATTFSTTRRDQDQDVWGIGVQNSKEWGDVRLITGMDYRDEDLSSRQGLYTYRKATDTMTFSEPAGNTPDGTYDVFDTFATLNWKPTEKWLLTGGLRYENSHIDSDPVALDVIPNAGYTINDLMLDKSWDSVTWNIGSIYDFTPEFSWAANVGSGFRAPTYSDVLSAGTPVFSSRIASVPAPDVDPERSITVETGPRYQSECFSASLTGYYTHLSDVVGSIESGTVTIPGQGTFIASKNANIGRGYVAGVETAVAWRFAEGWTAFGNGTYLRGEDTTANDPYRFIPPLNGTVGIRYESPSGKWWVELVEVMAAKLDRHSIRDEQDSGFSTDPGLGSPNTTTNPPLRADFSIPGFAVTNLRGGYKVWDRPDSSLALTLDLNNVLDAHYREAYSQQQREAPGFGAVVGARLGF
ncbi:MAG TPA: TonB-dependent receptor [Haloferula sp.]